MYVNLNEAFRFDNISIDGDMGYFIASVFGEGERLFSVDLKTNELTFICKFPEENDSAHAHPFCVKHNDFIYCLPVEKPNILRFNLKDKTWKEFSTDPSLSLQPNVTFAWNTGEYINMFMFNKCAMLSFDLKNNVQKTLYALSEAAPCSYDVCVDPANANICYTASYEEPKILKWDLNSMKCKTYFVPNMNEGIGSFVLHNSVFFITGYDSGDVYRWEIENNEVLKIKNDWNVKSCGSIPLLVGSRVLNNIIFFFSSVDKYIYYLPSNGVQIKRIAIPKSMTNVKIPSTYSLYSLHVKYDFVYTKDNIVGFYSYYDASIYEFNTINFEFKKLEYNMEIDNWEALMQSTHLNITMEGYDFYNEVFNYWLAHKRIESEGQSNIGYEILSLVKE